MEWLIIVALFGSFIFFLCVGVPISIAIALSAAIAISFILPIEIASVVVAQKMATGLDSFALLAIPFFILAGTIMNRGGIAMRLIEFAKLIVGRFHASLAHVNILSNMLFGSISGSAVASAAAVGSAMTPIQRKEGYAPSFSTAVNIASCPAGLMIPPSNALIIYALISGGTSISALFLAGYLPGIAMGLGLMITAAIIAKKNNYSKADRPNFSQALKITLDALPSLGLIVVVMGGIIGGFFTATEASAIAVIYTLLIAIFLYREISFKDLPNIILESVVTSSMVLLLIGASMGLSWAMAIADIPFMVTDALITLSENPLVILLLINLVLLIVGIFMDLTPAMLIFTPIFLPVARELGIDPVHFGIILTFNLCIGICTPPVGSALFVGCSVGNVKVNEIIKPLLPFYFVLIGLLVLLTFVPSLSLALPRWLLGYTG